MAATGVTRGASSRRPLSPRLASFLIAYGIVMIVGASSAPLALYETYARRFDFSDMILTGLAACSVVGVIAAAVFAGRLSDAVGRRPVLLPAAALGLLMLVLLAVATSVELLFVGRLVGGLSVGLFTGAGTAAMAELATDGDTRRAARVAATASVIGFASGPVVGGIFVEYLPWPLRSVYVVYAVLILPAVAGVALMRETVTRRGAWTLRPQALRTPPGGARTFALACLLALCAFGLTCMFQSLGPSIVIRLLDLDNRALVTLMVALFLASSAAVQLRFRNLPIRRATFVGLLFLPVGGLLITLSVIEGSIAAFVAGCLLGGVGQGLTYLGGQSLVEIVAPSSIRGEVFSTYLIVVYMSGSFPATVLGIAAKGVGLYAAIVGYTIVVASLAVATLVLCTRALRREPVRRAEPPPTLPERAMGG